MGMQLNNFLVEKKSGLYLPESGYKTFSYSDGIETEAYLSNILTHVHDKSSVSQELKSWIKDWPSRYHLSSSRANVLRPFSFLDQNAKVLELGAGCGAITRYLGENCLSVDAIEGSYTRSSIARERCSDLHNVKIFKKNMM
jgi:hypothetical protein